MTFTDQELKVAAATVNKALVYSLPDLSNYHPEYSEQFLQRMDHLIERRRWGRRFRIAASRAAMILLTFLIGASTWLAFRVDARAAMKNWMHEMYKNSIIYHFFNASTEVILTEIEVSSLPEGYLQVADHYNETSRILVYRNETDQLIVSLYPMNADLTLLQTGTPSGMVMINDILADVYISEDATTCELVLIDEAKRLTVVFSGSIDLNELIQAAQSIEITLSSK